MPQYVYRQTGLVAEQTKTLSELGWTHGFRADESWSMVFKVKFVSDANGAQVYALSAGGLPQTGSGRSFVILTSSGTNKQLDMVFRGADGAYLNVYFRGTQSGNYFYNVPSGTTYTIAYTYDATRYNARQSNAPNVAENDGGEAAEHWRRRSLVHMRKENGNWETPPFRNSNDHGGDAWDNYESRRLDVFSFGRVNTATAFELSDYLTTWRSLADLETLDAHTQYVAPPALPPPLLPPSPPPPPPPAPQPVQTVAGLQAGDRLGAVVAEQHRRARRRRAGGGRGARGGRPAGHDRARRRRRRVLWRGGGAQRRRRHAGGRPPEGGGGGGASYVDLPPRPGSDRGLGKRLSRLISTSSKAGPIC